MQATPPQQALSMQGSEATTLLPASSMPEDDYAEEGELEVQPL